MLARTSMRISMDNPVADLVATHSVCALILERYQIDYCSEGHRSLLAACDKHRLDPGRVLYQCGSAIRTRTDRPEVDPASLPTKQLLLTVIARHHRYLHDTLPLLPPLAERVAARHGEEQPVLRAIAIAVKSLSATLLAHITDEERTILPACGWDNASVVRDRLAATHDEHEDIIAALHTLRRLCNNFVCPSGACGEQRALYAELEHLERDTKRHAQVENDVLFRRFTST